MTGSPEGEDRRNIQPAQVRNELAERRQHRLADLVGQFGGRVVAVGRDPRDDHHDDHRHPEDLQKQRGHADDRPDHQLQRAVAVEHEHHHEGHQQRLDGHRQQQGRGVQAADAGDDAAQRRAAAGWRAPRTGSGVVEVGLDQLQHEAQQDDHRYRLTRVCTTKIMAPDNAFIDSSLFAQLLGQLGGTFCRGLQCLLDERPKPLPRTI